MFRCAGVVEESDEQGGLMPATKQNLEIEQGATFQYNVYWKDADTGLPIDISGYTGRMHIRESHDAVDPPLLELTNANSRLVLGGAAGTIQMVISATDTAALTFTEGVYDLELESPGGIVDRILYGGVEVAPEVTR